MEEQEKRAKNKRGDKCAFCKERPGFIRIQDISDIEYWICQVCNRMVDWE